MLWSQKQVFRFLGIWRWNNFRSSGLSSVLCDLAKYAHVKSVNKMFKLPIILLPLSFLLAVEAGTSWFGIGEFWMNLPRRRLEIIYNLQLAQQTPALSDSLRQIPKSSRHWRRLQMLWRSSFLISQFSQLVLPYPRGAAPQRRNRRQWKVAARQQQQWRRHLYQRQQRQQRRQVCQRMKFREKRRKSKMWRSRQSRQQSHLRRHQFPAPRRKMIWIWA